MIVGEIHGDFNHGIFGIAYFETNPFKGAYFLIVFSRSFSKSSKRGKFEVKLTKIWKDGIAEVGRAEESEKRMQKNEDQRKRQNKEDRGARKGRQAAKKCFFSNVVWLQRVDKYK